MQYLVIYGVGASQQSLPWSLRGGVSSALVLCSDGGDDGGIDNASAYHTLLKA